MFIYFIESMELNKEFRRNLDSFVERLTRDFGFPQETLVRLSKHLTENIVLVEKVERYSQLQVLTHCYMQLICAGRQNLAGYSVDVEREYKANGFPHDVLAVKGGEVDATEVETLYIDPYYSYEQEKYALARVVSKTARGSPYVGKFSIAIDTLHRIPVYEFMLIPPGKRRFETNRQLLEICKPYYRNPPMTEELMSRAHLDKIRVVSIDDATYEEIDPRLPSEYVELVGSVA